jgi:hypothetical protein
MRAQLSVKAARGTRGAAPTDARLPTDGVLALVAGARASRLAAAFLRWAGACAVGFAGLLLVAVALASFERKAPPEPPGGSATAYLDFDLAVLQHVTEASLRLVTADDEHHALLALWSLRPEWRVAPPRHEAEGLVSLADAWSATAADKSRFRTAARGAAAALPFLVSGLALACLAAAAGGVLAQLRGLARAKRWQRAAAVAFCAGAYLLVVHPLWPLLQPAVFYDRTRSLGLGFSAALFVAAFAGTLPGAAARALFAPPPQARSLSALGGRPALLAAARLAVLDATDWLVPLVPALAAVSLFVCAKADQDPGVADATSGLGSLVRSAIAESAVSDRLSSCALVGGALVLLWFVGHRFVLELRCALGATRTPQ